MRWGVIIAIAGCGRINYGANDFCADKASAAFCADFDDGIADWDSVIGPAYASLTTVHDTPITQQLDIASSSVPTADYGQVYLVRMLGVSGTHAAAEMSVRVDAAGTGDFALAQVRFDDAAATTHAIEYVYRAPPLTSYLEEIRIVGGNSVFDSYVCPTLPLGEWHRVKLDMTATRAQVMYDSGVVLDTPLNGNTAGEARAYLGIVYVSGPADAADFQFDNFVIYVD